MSEKQGRIHLTLTPQQQGKLQILQNAMSKKMGRKVLLEEIIENAIDQLLEGIFEDPESGLEQEPK